MRAKKGKAKVETVSRVRGINSVRNWVNLIQVWINEKLGNFPRSYREKKLWLDFRSYTWNQKTILGFLRVQSCEWEKPLGLAREEVKKDQRTVQEWGLWYCWLCTSWLTINCLPTCHLCPDISHSVVKLIVYSQHWQSGGGARGGLRKILVPVARSGFKTEETVLEGGADAIRLDVGTHTWRRMLWNTWNTPLPRCQ